MLSHSEEALRPASPLRLGVLCLAAAVGCVGEVSDRSGEHATGPSGDAPASAPGGGGVKGGTGGGTTTTSPGACAVAPSTWRKLTNFEYQNTVRDLFPGLDVGPATGELAADVTRDLFDNQTAVQGVSVTVVDGYYKAAQRLASGAAADADKLLGCAVASKGEDPCFAAFIDGFGQRAFRRPLTPAERMRLDATYRTSKADGGFRFALETVLQRLLVSPQLLYRTEPAKLDSWAMASRLSFFLWGGPPDADLYAAAAAGKLLDRAEVARQADRMLMDARAAAGLGHFFDQLLDLAIVPKQSKDAKLFPKFTAAVAKLMATETQTFLRALSTSSDLRLEDLFAGTYSFLNKDLAAYYGVPGPAGAAFEKTALDPAHAAGYLTQGSFAVLTSREQTTSPIARGKLLRTRLLCETLPEPPEGVPPPPKFTGTETMRELLAKHSVDPSCGGCHRLLDPVGLGLENLDAAGRWRDRDNGGQAVDASGEVVGTDVPGPFRGAVELGQRLGGSAQARACFTQKLLTYALGRATGDGDRCVVDAVEAARVRAGGSVRALVTALASSDPLTTRVVAP
jgi:hypothetical protein